MPRKGIDEPPVEQLTARPYEGADDAERIAELINRSRVSAGEENRTVSTETVRSFLETAWAGFDARTDVHLFFRDGTLIAYERTKRETWAGGARVYHVLPFISLAWRNREVLTEVFEHVCRYQSAYGARDRTATERFLSVVPDPADAVTIDALLAAGFAPCHHFLQMARRLDGDVVQRDLPAGLELRPLHEDQYRAVYAFDRRIMLGHWGVEAPTEEHFRWWAQEAFLNPELWRVAWQRDAIVAVAAGAVGGTWNPSLGGERGEIRFVRVDPKWRRRGVASALILRCLAALRERGIREVVLGVDGANEATAAALYRTLGFEIVSRTVAFRRDIDEPCSARGAGRSRCPSGRRPT